MYISGAKFEEHCFNISWDILDWVFYCFSGTTHDVITFLICITRKCKYVENEKIYLKKENAIFIYFGSLSIKQQLFFTSLALKRDVKITINYPL